MPNASTPALCNACNTACPDFRETGRSALLPPNSTATRPNDFGSSPVRPAGDNTAPSKGESAARWSWHGFLATDARVVLRDITLDGNTFRDSHSVDKKPVVGEAAIGAAMTYGAWKIALARYFRTREFDGQDMRPSYGSFTISREF